MTKTLPFTAPGITRRIKGVMGAGLHALAVTPDGTVLIGDKPLDVASIALANAPTSPPPARRFGEKLNGGAREA